MGPGWCSILLDQLAQDWIRVAWVRNVEAFCWIGQHVAGSSRTRPDWTIHGWPDHKAQVQSREVLVPFRAACRQESILRQCRSGSGCVGFGSWTNPM